MLDAKKLFCKQKPLLKNAYAIAKGTGIIFIGTIIGMFLGFVSLIVIVRYTTQSEYDIYFLSGKINLIVVINMGIRVKARYEDKVLKPFVELDLKEGEEVEIVIAGSLAKDFRGALKLENAELIEEIAESDELI